MIRRARYGAVSPPTAKLLLMPGAGCWIRRYATVPAGSDSHRHAGVVQDLHQHLDSWPVVVGQLLFRSQQPNGREHSYEDESQSKHTDQKNSYAIHVYLQESEWEGSE